MAAYMPQGQYSLLNDPQFETAYSGIKASNMVDKAPVQEESILGDKDTRQAAAAGMRSGGLSGALLSGGIASGNPYAIGGGLILSQIEEAQKAKAAQEQERIENEKARMVAMKTQYNNMANMSFKI